MNERGLTGDGETWWAGEIREMGEMFEDVEGMFVVGSTLDYYHSV